MQSSYTRVDLGLSSCSVPEPMELVLPVALLADVQVARDSIGTPVLSIPACSSVFSPARMLEGHNRWVPGNTGSQGFLTQRLWHRYLNFSLKSSSSGHKGHKETLSSHLFYDLAP